MAELKKLTARTGYSSYGILIGKDILDLDEIKNFIPQNADKTAVVASKRVYGLHEKTLDRFFDRFPGSQIFMMDDGEENKNYALAGMYLDKFIQAGLSRKSAVLGAGGGVVGDFAGFLSSIYMRGIPVYHLPTTLLSMVDSSIGGKTAVNLSKGKNMAGVFHQPGSVLMDIRFLDTLPDDEFKNGLAESLKHGLIGDGKSLDILESNDLGSIRNGDVMTELISASVEFKLSVVERDEREGGLRAILNFGHTVGHALESLMDYTGIPHGKAVAVGMMVEAGISMRNGWLGDDELSRIGSVMRSYGLLDVDLDLDPHDVLSHMRFDKKNSGGGINLVLLRSLGSPEFNVRVDEKTIIESLSEYMAVRRGI